MTAWKAGSIVGAAAVVGETAPAVLAPVVFFELPHAPATTATRTTTGTARRRSRNGRDNMVETPPVWSPLVLTVRDRAAGKSSCRRVFLMRIRPLVTPVNEDFRDV